MTGGEAGSVQMKNEMDMAASIGCMRITAPAAGVDESLSLELFNEAYWHDDPVKVASKGLIKMKKLLETIR